MRYENSLLGIGYHVIVPTGKRGAIEMAREKSNGWFRGPNMIFEQEEISIYAAHIYLYLCRCSNKQNQCFPTLGDIGQKCKIKCKKRVRKALKELISVGLITMENRKGKHGDYTSSLFTVYEKPIISAITEVGVGADNPHLGADNPQVGAETVPKGRLTEGRSFQGRSFQGLPTMRASEREGLEKDPPAPAGASEKCAHGRYGLVRLTAAEYEELIAEHGREKVEDYINRVDEHMAGKGVQYKNHAAVIQKWIREDDAKAAEKKAKEEKWAEEKRIKNGHSKPSKRTPEQWKELERKEREYIRRTAGGDDGDEDGDDLDDLLI